MNIKTTILNLCPIITTLLIVMGYDVFSLEKPFLLAFTIVSLIISFNIISNLYKAIVDEIKNKHNK